MTDFSIASSDEIASAFVPEMIVAANMVIGIIKGTSVSLNRVSPNSFEIIMSGGVSIYMTYRDQRYYVNYWKTTDGRSRRIAHRHELERTIPEASLEKEIRIIIASF